MWLQSLVSQPLPEEVHRQFEMLPVYQLAAAARELPRIGTEAFRWKPFIARPSAPRSSATR